MVLENRENERILGHIFNKTNNNIDHIEKREEETMKMMAAIGRNIQDNNMDKMYMQSIIILYKKCMLPKLIYGLVGFYLSENEIDKIEKINRKLIRKMGRLPISTTNAVLYNEFGARPIKYELYKRKLMMWWRIEREESNITLKSCKREQVKEDLPWLKEIIKIANRLKIKLEEARITNKEKWKRIIKEKIKEESQKELEEEINKTKLYKENVEDQVEWEKLRNTWY